MVRCVSVSPVSSRTTFVPFRPLHQIALECLVCSCFVVWGVGEPPIFVGTREGGMHEESMVECREERLHHSGGL